MSTRCGCNDYTRKDGQCIEAAVGTYPVEDERVPMCWGHAECWLAGDVLVSRYRRGSS